MNRRTAVGHATRLVAVLWLVSTVSGLALAHGGSLRGSSESLSVPLWLFLLTGGGAVSASFLLASFVTDRALILEIHDWRRFAPLSSDTLVTTVRAGGVFVLVGIVVGGLLGPADARRNVAILVVWVGWWAGYTVSVYLVGNTWPVVNPWRTLTDFFRAIAYLVGNTWPVVNLQRMLTDFFGSILPSLDADYPKQLGAWPSVVGLLALVWLEVVSPLADNAELLVDVIVVYSVVTLAGALAFGSDRWFSTVDPVARVFRYYGRVAPIRRTESGFEFQLPGARLTETKLVTGRDEVAFVVAILWVTTYDGFVVTDLWADIAGVGVDAGLPPRFVYLLGLLGGYALFLGVYWLAVRFARDTADSYLTPDEIARRFAPSLLPIAAGYHLAHYLSYFLSLSPALFSALASPLNPPQPEYIVLPSWFGGLNMTFVLLGHLLAVWVAHATAYDLFPGRLQAVRSQYPLVVVMILYTMTSLWIVSQPTLASLPEL